MPAVEFLCKRATDTGLTPKAHAHALFARCLLAPGSVQREALTSLLRVLCDATAATPLPPAVTFCFLTLLSLLCRLTSSQTSAFFLPGKKGPGDRALSKSRRPPWAFFFLAALRPRRRDSLQGRGQSGKGRQSEGSTAETARKRPERPWTAARTMEVLSLIHI